MERDYRERILFSFLYFTLCTSGGINRVYVGNNLVIDGINYLFSRNKKRSTYKRCSPLSGKKYVSLLSLFDIVFHLISLKTLVILFFYWCHSFWLGGTELIFPILLKISIELVLLKNRVRGGERDSLYDFYGGFWKNTFRG